MRSFENKFAGRSKVLMLSSMALMLCACSHAPVVIHASPPEAYLVMCPARLPNPYEAARTAPGGMTAAEALDDDVSVAGVYDRCAAAHNALIEWHLR